MSAQNATPVLGATFYPGKDDDYLMPTEVVSPSPQRVMPEVPEQIADSLATLELEASSVPRHRVQVSRTELPLAKDYRDSSAYYDMPGEYPSYSGFAAGHEEQHYSPFPKLSNPGPSVPPTWEEKEVMIEQARIEVLSSNDPELQLSWAQDALNFVETSIAHLARISGGEQYDTPELEHQIKTDAINVVSFLADQRHPRAEFIRGSWLEFGKFGYRVDKKEAFRCYSRAAERGYARAEYRMGMQYENSNEPMKAIKHYTQGATLGDSASNYRLGMMTLLGQHGQKQDYARGVHLIRLAAQSADENAPQGAYVYGMLLARELPGITVPDAFLPQDIRLAKEMIERAAFLGFARAQLKMGTAYELCQLGCEFNPALSLHYNALAARQGEPEAEMAISKWFLCGHEGVFEKNEELAFVYAERAAKSGLATAEFAMGYFYEIGMYVKVDLQEAQRWYAKAAAHGNKDASGRIDGISRSKTLSRRDHENIAISKIKARHASQRLKVNPIAERQRAAQAQTISETIEMPDPTVPEDSGAYSPSLGAGAFPPRASSRVPSANTSFINPDIFTGQKQGQGQTFNPGPLQRISTAPYPTDDQPFPTGNNQTFIRPGSSGGLLNPQKRPMSPSVKPHPPRLDPGQTQRPSTTQSAAQRPGSGRPYPRPQQSPTIRPVEPQQGQVYPGFEADVSKPNRNSVSKPGSAPPVSLGFEAPPIKPTIANMPQKSPVGQQRPTPGPAPSSPGRNPQRPPPPAAVLEPPKVASPAPTSKPPPAGKGPKTFEEMGVPVAKKEDECAIM